MYLPALMLRFALVNFTMLHFVIPGALPSDASGGQTTVSAVSTPHHELNSIVRRVEKSARNASSLLRCSLRTASTLVLVLFAT